MSFLGTLLCLVAAYRLHATPLFTIAAVTAALNVAAVTGSVALVATGKTPPRTLVALKHVSAALAAFFLFVSFEMPDVPK